MSLCDPCSDFSYIRDVPACAETLNLGEVTASTGEVSIYVRYTLGDDEVIYRQDYDQDGYTDDIILDLTRSSSDFYNSQNGLYLIWVTDKGASITDRLTMSASNGIQDDIWGVKFVDIEGAAFDDIIAEPI